MRTVAALAVVALVTDLDTHGSTVKQFDKDSNACANWAEP